MSEKTYAITFGDEALPGVLAIGSIRRGQTVQVDAAKAVRLVDVKGLAFANATDERGARAALKTPPASASAETIPTTHEEH